MAAGLYAKKIRNYEKAVGCIRNYLNGKTERSSDDVDMVLMLSDICLENRNYELSVETLESELAHKYASADKRLLELRLEALKPACKTD